MSSLAAFNLPETMEKSLFCFIYIKTKQPLIDLHVIKLIHEFSVFNKEEHTLEKMAKKGNYEVLKFLLLNFIYSEPKKQEAALIAAEFNHPSCIDLLCPYKSSVFKRKLLFHSIRNDSFYAFAGIFNSLRGENVDIYARQAVRMEAISILKFLLKAGRVRPAEILDYAAEIRCYKVIRFIEMTARHYH